MRIILILAITLLLLTFTTEPTVGTPSPLATPTAVTSPLPTPDTWPTPTDGTHPLAVRLTSFTARSR